MSQAPADQHHPDGQPQPDGKPQPDEQPQPKGQPQSDRQSQPPGDGRPIYKGEPLDAERGPGLGCFWIQVVLLVVLLVLTPLTVAWAMPSWVSAALLILTLVILFFVGQTMIFLLRLVAADRRAQRRVPQANEARKTVGQLEDESNAPAALAETTPETSDEDDARPDQR